MRTLSIIVAATSVMAIPAGAQTMTPAQFVAKAGAGDLYERTSSRLVLQSTQNAKVRSFAQMMEKDHAKSTADVKAAAARGGVAATPPKLDAAQTKMIADLKAASGQKRDQLYVSQQKTAHQQALALHQRYAATGTAAPLKSAAATIAPVVQHHIDMLNAM